ncbi:MAG: DNA methyltransferase, partial [bacterium]
MLKPELKNIKLSEIIFDEIIYPRHAHDPALVQQYAGCIDEIEAHNNYISVSSDNKLLDGKHRWLAYRKLFDNVIDKEIQAFIYQVTSPHEQLKIATELNSSHGWQLTEQDKEKTAKALYAYGYTYDVIAKTLSVGKNKVSGWLAQIVKKEKEQRDKKVFNMWLACYTQEEIAEAVNMDKSSISRFVEKDLLHLVSENQMQQINSSFMQDFEIPLYNVWAFGKKTNEVTHFGNSEQRIVDNLLYLYTDIYDIVVDPFAGGGSTINVCKKRLRRYYVSDRKPIIEREKEIRTHDITQGLPPVPRWQDVKLVYLDPPYWKQAEGQYSSDPTDLANMDADTFHKTLIDLIIGFAKKLKKDSIIALLIQPTQWKSDNKAFTDHIITITKEVKLTLENRISCPYSSQQCTPQMVNWAKENKK